MWSQNGLAGGRSFPQMGCVQFCAANSPSWVLQPQAWGSFIPSAVLGTQYSLCG